MSGSDSQYGIVRWFNLWPTACMLPTRPFLAALNPLLPPASAAFLFPFCFTVPFPLEKEEWHSRDIGKPCHTHRLLCEFGVSEPRSSCFSNYFSIDTVRGVLLGSCFPPIVFKLEHHRLECLQMRKFWPQNLLGNGSVCIFQPNVLHGDVVRIKCSQPWWGQVFLNTAIYCTILCTYYV